MAKRRARKPIITKRPYPKKRLERRIVIPSNPERPLQANQRDLIIGEALRPETPWFTLHRKGVRRLMVGEDILEARAVPKGYVRGTLPERVLYKTFTSIFKFSANIDFTFQSSLQGGRMELGGIVADFIFPYKMLVFQVQGPTHTQLVRKAKDREQWLALEEMGYTVKYAELDLVFDEFRLEAWLRDIFNLSANQTSGTGVGFYGDEAENQSEKELLDKIEEIGVLIDA